MQPIDAAQATSNDAVMGVASFSSPTLNTSSNNREQEKHILPRTVKVYNSK